MLVLEEDESWECGPNYPTKRYMPTNGNGISKYEYLYKISKKLSIFKFLMLACCA
jgi:hypothetical protein